MSYSDSLAKRFYKYRKLVHNIMIRSHSLLSKFGFNLPFTCHAMSNSIFVEAQHRNVNSIIIVII